MEKVKLIRGSEERAEEIIKTLEEWGGTNKCDLLCRNDKNYYYVDAFGYINYCYAIDGNHRIAEGKAEIYELPPLKPKFEPFEKVLVRDDDGDEWDCDFFSRLRNDFYVCVAHAWVQCIPYEGNEHLLGTTTNP